MLAEIEEIAKKQDNIQKGQDKIFQLLNQMSKQVGIDDSCGDRVGPGYGGHYSISSVLQHPTLNCCFKNFR